MTNYLKAGVLMLGLLFNLQALAQASPTAALDTLHKAGADANEAAFTAVLAQDVVFLGTDGAPRLQGQALRDFINASFTGGKSWDYRSGAREIQLSADGTVAWFDESLEHDQLGSGRASGVLTQTDGIWKIVQYNLTMRLPGTASVPETPQKPACKKIRHKTNTQASC